LKTVDKAIALLAHFSVKDPELGLTEIARLSGLDKATTLRLLASLRKHGFVEQNAVSKKYHLGSGLIRFARVREASFPTSAVMQPVLQKLAVDVGETVHCTLATSSGLISVASAEPPRTTRAYIDPGQELPFHATASGLAYLAFSDDDVVKDALKSASLTAFTNNTITSADEIRRALDRARQRGYAKANRTFEMEVVSMAAPTFDWSARARGAVSIACIASRWQNNLEAGFAAKVTSAAIEITKATGGVPSQTFLASAGGSSEQ
jgi:IclR family transcriptional regulator, acetate operon repressor